MTRTAVPLQDGASVAVIGAGPAGTFFALHLLSLLGKAGRSVRVTLFDRKQFDCSGPSGCNMCAGAIGASMIRKIGNLGLPFEDRVIRRIADGYAIHGHDISVNVSSPEKGDIYTVFRGGGPTSASGRSKSFDQYLLDAAVGRGADFLNERVESVERTDRGFRLGFHGGTRKNFDFLVGAFGVNSAISRKIHGGYVPPATWHTVQAEIPADNDFITGRLENRIHIIPATEKSIHFLAITPKDDFITLTGIGEHVRIADIERERNANGVLAGLLPRDAPMLCHCHPQVPVGTARRPFAERLAIVGDAFISRYLKNGIESSFDTSGILAKAVVDHGVSAGCLDRHFYRPCMHLFRYDNVWGKALFGMYEAVLRKRGLSEMYLRAVKSEESGGTGVQSRILWSVFAGDAPYREIALEAFSPRAVGHLLAGMSRKR